MTSVIISVLVALFFIWLIPTIIHKYIVPKYNDYIYKKAVVEKQFRYRIGIDFFPNYWIYLIGIFIALILSIGSLVIINKL